MRRIRVSVIESFDKIMEIIVEQHYMHGFSIECEKRTKESLNEKLRDDPSGRQIYCRKAGEVVCAWLHRGSVHN